MAARLFKDFLARENPFKANLDHNPTDEYFIEETLHYYALLIHDALFDALTRAALLPEKVREEGARDYLRFGVARRLNMLWYSYHGLTGTVSAHRKTPLSDDESRELTRDVNVIYLNVTGVLDNLCHALLHECAAESLKLPPNKLGLFQSAVVDDQRFASLAAILANHKDWDRDVKKRRNPAAHRIPLYVPSQILNQSDATKYNEIIREHGEMVKAKNFEAADVQWDKLETVGNFSPVFLHDPKDGMYRIYPTISDDIAHVIAVLDAVESFFVPLRGERS